MGWLQVGTAALIAWGNVALGGESGPENRANASSRALTNGVSTAAAPAALSETLDAAYRLAIGDQLSFRIVEDEEDAMRLAIMDSGELDVPYVGRIPAAGRTCRELADLLKIELERNYYYHATVLLAVDSRTKNRGKVYLLGAVRTPGTVDLPSDEVLTVSKAILRGGGFGDFADQKHVRVTRKKAGDGSSVTVVVDVSQLLSAGKLSEDPPLEAGDLVYVPERTFRF